MTMNFITYSNGNKVNAQLDLHALDLESVGIFESLRTYNGKIFRREDHLRRFMESAKTSGVEIDIKRLNSELSQAIEAYTFSCHSEAKPKNLGTLTEAQILSAHQTGGPAGLIGGRYAQDDKRASDLFIRLTLWKEQVFVMIGQRNHSDALYKEGVRLRTSPVKRTHSNAAPAEIKTTAYQNAVMASLEPAQGVYEWLFLDRDGFATEVRIGNLFIIKNDALFTPPNTGILNGVTRRFVIECAVQIGKPVREIPITRHEIYNADEAFLTNTSWEILPIRELDGRRIGKDLPGPLTEKLQRIFKEKSRLECS
jgi:branched-chain amino acid aminotransferase